MKLDREHRLLERTLRAFKTKLTQLPRHVRDKGGDLGPLTELDHHVDRELYRAIRESFAADGWMSEESPHEPGTGPGAQRLWIVDPIDGTREIVAGIGEWAVSVGLWEGAAPLYGWLYNASRDVLWHGGPGLGAWAEERETRRPVRVREPGPVADLAVGVSRTDLTRGLFQAASPAPTPIGSIAYKLGLVAAGEIDATVSLTPKNAWDIAGGIAVVLGAGGSVVSLDDGRPLSLGEKTLHEGGLVAGHPDVVQELRRRYSKKSEKGV